jgi:hypothetical protein
LVVITILEKGIVSQKGLQQQYSKFVLSPDRRVCRELSCTGGTASFELTSDL